MVPVRYSTCGDGTRVTASPGCMEEHQSVMQYVQMYSHMHAHQTMHVFCVAHTVLGDCTHNQTMGAAACKLDRTAATPCSCLGGETSTDVVMTVGLTADHSGLLGWDQGALSVGVVSEAESSRARSGTGAISSLCPFCRGGCAGLGWTCGRGTLRGENSRCVVYGSHDHVS